MNTILQMDGVDIFPDLIRGGLKEISTDLMNDDGSLAIGSASVKLSNLTGAYETILANKTIIPNLDITIADKPFFNGKAAVGGVKYDASQYILDLQFIHKTKEFIEELKSINLQDLNISQTDQDVFYTTDSSHKNITRAFFPLAAVLEQVIKKTSFSFEVAAIEINPVYYIGGAVKVIGRALLPDWNGYDYLQELVKVFNGIWWIDTSNRFYFKRKLTLANERLNDTAILLQPFKGTPAKNNEFREISSVEFSYANASDEIFKGDKTLARAIVKKSIARSSKTVSTRFKIPRVPGFTYGYIPSGDVESADFLITKNDVDNRAASGCSCTPAYTIAYNEYLIDRLVGIGIEFDASLMNDEALLQQWPLVFTKVRIPDDNRDYYIFSASLAPYEERMNIRAFNWDYHL